MALALRRTIKLFMDKTFNRFLFLIYVFSLAGCDVSDPLSDYEARPVVEAYLTGGDTIHILVTKEILLGSADTIAETINGLTPVVRVDTEIIPLQNTGEGIYSAPAIILEEKEYTLEFEYGGHVIHATTTIPSKPKGFAMSVDELTISPIVFGGGFPGSRPTFPDPVKLTWINEDQSYYLSAFKNTEDSPESIFDGQLVFGGRNRPPLFNQPTRLSGAEIETPRIQYYGYHDILLLHVQPEYAALYENNGSNSLNLAPPPTNIENGLGIFTGIASDTLRLLVKKP